MLVVNVAFNVMSVFRIYFAAIILKYNFVVYKTYSRMSLRYILCCKRLC